MTLGITLLLFGSVDTCIHPPCSNLQTTAAAAEDRVQASLDGAGGAAAEALRRLTLPPQGPREAMAAVTRTPGLDLRRKDIQYCIVLQAQLRTFFGSRSRFMMMLEAASRGPISQKVFSRLMHGYRRTVAVAAPTQAWAKGHARPKPPRRARRPSERRLMEFYLAPEWPRR